MTKFISIFTVLLMLMALSAHAARDEATARAIWTFDEGNAADTSGNNVNGNLVGDSSSCRRYRRKSVSIRRDR